MENIIRVVCGLCIVNKYGKVLMGKRINSYAANTWCSPGGVVEFLETTKDACIREIFEETGLKFQPEDLSLFCDQYEHIDKKENKHFVGTTYITFVDTARPQIMEPEKCAEWKWFGKADFPKDEELTWPALAYKDKLFKYLK